MVKRIKTMSKSKIEEYYLHLSKSDKKDIEAFLKLPFINQSDYLNKLHEFFSEQIHFETEWDKNECFHYVFGPEMPYSDLSLRVYQSRLLKVLEKFMMLRSIEEQPKLSFEASNYFYTKNKMKKNLHFLLHSDIKNSEPNAEDNFNFEYQKSKNKLTYLIQNESNIDKLSQSYSEYFQKKEHKLIFEIIESACLHLNLEARMKQIKPIEFINDSILEDIIEKRLLYPKFINWYISLYLILKNNDMDSFLFLKDEVILDQENIEDSKTMITYLSNFCIKKINAGNNDFLEYLFELYKASLRHYHHEGDLPSERFRNIVFCGLQIQEMEWVANFINEYHKLVPYADQENSYNFNLARMYFEKNEYHQAMRQLLQVKYTDAFYALNARILIIRCYFMLKDEEALNYNCSSLYIYIKRNKSFSNERAANHLNFLKFIKKLYALHFKATASKKKHLKTQIDEANMINKKWLLEQLEKM